MASSKGLLVAWIVALVAVAMLATVLESDPAGDSKQFLVAHNDARKARGVGPLVWSDKLEEEARQYVGKQHDESGCGFADLSSTPCGANQAVSSYPASPELVVSTWVGEGVYYNYKNNTCSKDHDCGTYTQVVWRKTKEVGCAQATCANKGGTTLTLCLYYPHGNSKNLRPY